MPMQDFADLFGHYPEILAAMPEEFSSHQFILELARRHQDLYVEALYAYRDSAHEGRPAPFKVVHGKLASHLAQLPELANLGERSSIDIFGQDGQCAFWRKL